MLAKVNDPRDVSSRVRYKLYECPEYAVKLTVSMSSADVASADVECEYTVGTDLHQILHRCRCSAVSGAGQCPLCTQCAAHSVWAPSM